VWLRTALLLILFLLVFRWISRLLSGPAKSSSDPKPESGRTSKEPPAKTWTPADVIDVDYTEVPSGDAPRTAKTPE